MQIEVLTPPLICEGKEIVFYSQSWPIITMYGIKFCVLYTH